jgi:hypothetical protein
MRDAVAETKELTRRQRLVLERKEEALTAFNRRIRHTGPQPD